MHTGKELKHASTTMYKVESEKQELLFLFLSFFFFLPSLAESLCCLERDPEAKWGGAGARVGGGGGVQS